VAAKNALGGRTEDSHSTSSGVEELEGEEQERGRRRGGCGSSGKRKEAGLVLIRRTLPGRYQLRRERNA
jgi:hypothetical protein